jgi:CheY-like chemotaxis protein
MLDRPEPPSHPPATNSQGAVLSELHEIFLQTVTHELRTPLSILQGYAELLRAEALGPLASAQTRAAEIIVARAKELSRHVERIDVLLATRAGATVSLPVQLIEILDQLADSHRPEAKRRGVSLELSVAPGYPRIACDPYQLQLAIDCLLDNALKFTPRGGQVFLRAFSESGWVCIQVADTGIGMPEKEKERVLNPFYQIDGSTVRKYGGMGLGLGVVKAVVAEHGGDIDVFSQPGRGSRLTIKLPASRIVDETKAQHDDDDRPQRILVVDDEASVAFTVQAALEKLPNCTVHVAASGDEALDVFAERPFDLLITDYKMPGTDGLTLAAQVRSAYPLTAIIIITGFSTQELLERARELSIARVLDKPVQIEMIRDIALDALGKNGTRTSDAKYGEREHDGYPDPRC